MANKSKYRPTNSWKKVEAAVARFWPGAKRRGADFRGEDTAGKTDIVCPGWAIEVKHSKRPQWALIRGAVLQAETNATNPDDIPVAVIHQEGMQYKDSLVVMRLEKFAEFFINEQKEWPVRYTDQQDALKVFGLPGYLYLTKPQDQEAGG